MIKRRVSLPFSFSPVLPLFSCFCSRFPPKSVEFPIVVPWVINDNRGSVVVSSRRVGKYKNCARKKVKTGYQKILRASFMRSLQEILFFFFHFYIPLRREKTEIPISNSCQPHRSRTLLDCNVLYCATHQSTLSKVSAV